MAMLVPNSDAILSYDATLALLNGAKKSLSVGRSGKQDVSPDELRQALSQIKGIQTLQGISGPQGEKEYPQR